MVRRPKVRLLLHSSATGRFGIQWFVAQNNYGFVISGSGFGAGEWFGVDRFVGQTTGFGAQGFVDENWKFLYFWNLHDEGIVVTPKWLESDSKRARSSREKLREQSL
ncbi:hypothetical protein E3N88_17993 [Mikania micrantha]|uniref:Uncharacterized protein n=1 Tax=Mikania micrantha TaxID=192012 RepID=A0A5N6NWH2_9ASTR|nr:hypothetical protein E3N88_17993 [Mikania micrantha]